MYRPASAALLYAVMTSSAEVNLREPRVLDTCDMPTRWVIETRVLPLWPRLVRITMTPLAAFEPYRAAAEAPLRTSRLSMSLGLRSAMRLTGLSWLDVLPPAAAAVMALTPDGTETLLRMTPSITYSGDD